MNVSRRSLCDNCVVDVCLRRDGSRGGECPGFRPAFMAFKRCAGCGEVFEVASNFRALDPDMCPRCDRSRWGLK